MDKMEFFVLSQIDRKTDRRAYMVKNCIDTINQTKPKRGMSHEKQTYTNVIIVPYTKRVMVN